MKCDWLGRLVKTELTPYVSCVVGEPAWEICTATSEQPVNENVWRHRGVEEKDQTEVIKGGLLISACRTSGWGPVCSCPGVQLLLCSCDTLVWPHWADWERRGQSAITDEFQICGRWFIRALQRSVGYFTPGSSSNRPQHEPTVLTNREWNLFPSLFH